MTLVASFIFLSALAVSALAIARTIGHAMPRIIEIIEAEFEQVVLKKRRVTLGAIRVQESRSGEVIVLQRSMRVEREFQLAA